VTIRFLLDTNALSEPLRPRPDPKFIKRLERHQDEISTAAPVWHEVLFGIFRLPSNRRRRALETYLNEVLRPNLLIFPYDARAAEWHAEERARLARVGRTPPFVDGQIAAIAATNDVEIVTTNLEDFRGFQGIRITDWRS
jgi:tRNA(fMet)-specific endonuclease VapC